MAERHLIRVLVTLAVFGSPPALLRGEQKGPEDEGLRITHGVASGEVTHDSVVIWARANALAEMVVEVDTDPSFPRPRTGRDSNSRATDLAAQVKIRGLAAGTRHHYRVRFENRDGASAWEEGTFTAALAPTATAPVRLIVGGDLGGQRYCRHAERGYEIFRHMEALAPDFFVANGDMIYADGDCPAQGPGGWENVPGDFPSVSSLEVDWTDPAEVQRVYWRHWRYNRADPHFQSFLRKTPMYVQWDDHEVINDFGADWPVWPRDVERPGFPNLVAAGRGSLFAFHPLERHPTERDRIYRSFRWGRDLELFLLDGRSYRSMNDLADTAANRKALLGREQLEWLKEGLASSDATWKLVSSDVPFSVPTGTNSHLYGRDSWANGTRSDFSSRTGFEQELMELVSFLDRRNVKNVVIVVTDVHFAMNVRYALDADGDRDTLVLYELISGPLNAGRTAAPVGLDPTLSPAILYAEGGMFNFSFITVERQPDGEMHLIAEVRDETGNVRFGSRLDLVAERATAKNPDTTVD